ncbi:MAG: PD-(D/E)XK nuclease family protein [Rikenellaceae bacterium]
MDSSFIKETIDKLYEIYGEQVSEIKVLLPSSRAQLFFNRDLSAKLTGKPIWQPNFYSVNSLTKKITSLTATTPFRLITELYKVYKEYHHNETFDQFYYWGDMLVKDFDTIDNYMVDAKLLLVNINDIKVIENEFDYLSEEQAEMVRRFWKVFTPTEEGYSSHKQSFLTIWNTLYPIYEKYKAELRKNGIGYKGMIYREAAEKLESGVDEDFFEEGYFDKGSIFAFIGFNALSKSEKKLFKHIQEHYTTHFFWDYDDYYVTDKKQEAGLFVRSNIAEFGEECVDISRDNFSKKKDITIINSPSVSLECKYVWNFLKNLYAEKGKLGSETAVVLTNEEMLLPVMYSIPEEIEYFNVTSGFSISQTAAYSFLEYLIKLQVNKKVDSKSEVSFYYKDVLSVFNHPYFLLLLDEQQREKVILISEMINSDSQIYVNQQNFELFGDLNKIFDNVKSPAVMSGYIVEIFTFVIERLPNDDTRKERREFINSIIEATQTTNNTIDNCDVDVPMAIFLSLLRKHISSQSISFMGEPLLGVQVMGILETRNLDFENILLLSVNEDNFPGTNVGKSFIPNSLRWGYQLPTPYHSEAMYSYYFYRLIQRAKNVHITYCSKSEGTTSGEPSRYIHQLKLESPFRDTVVEKSLSLSVNIEKNEVSIAEKDEKIYGELKRFLGGDKILSPSALYSYISCPYKFYLRYIKGLQEPKEISETLDSRDFGNIVHDTLRIIYDNEIDKDKDIKTELEKISDDRIKELVESLVSKVVKIEVENFTGQINTLLSFMCKGVRNVLNYDLANPDFKSYKHEDNISNFVEINIAGQPCKLKIAGRIDRIDILNNGNYRYIDYKTGGMHLKTSSVSSLFDIENKSNSIAIMQVFLYAYLTEQEVVPALYFTREMNKAKYNHKIIVGKDEVNVFSSVKEEFGEVLKGKLEELFDRTVPFNCTTEPTTCEYCVYKNLCKG